MREVLIYEDEGVYFASVPSLPNVRTQGDTFDAALSGVRAAIQTYPSGPVVEPNGSLALIAREVTPNGIDDVRVFSPPPISPAGEAWAMNKLRELIASGDLPASVLQTAPEATRE